MPPVPAKPAQMMVVWVVHEALMQEVLPTAVDAV
jgi:hypothetical protein